jgi:hypothetical protein
MQMQGGTEKSDKMESHFIRISTNCQWLSLGQDNQIDEVAVITGSLIYFLGEGQQYDVNIKTLHDS